MKLNPQFEDQDGWLTHTHRFGRDVIRFRARDVRHERTGVHAHVQITLNQVVLGATVFNVERDEDRVRLANSAYKQLKGEAYDELRREMPDTWFKHALDVFCLGMWEERLRRMAPKRLNGNTERPIVQLVRGLVIEGGGTVIYAPPGFGKTNMLLALAVCMDAGLSIPDVFELGRPIPVMFINLERSAESMEYRLGRVNTALGLPEDRPLPFVNERGKSLMDVYDPAQEYMRSEGLEVVFFDSLSRAGGSLVEDDAANRTMDRLNALSRTWVASGHTPRADRTHLFGSQMFDAAVDVAVQLISEKQPSTLGIGLQVTKENDLGPTSLKLLALEFGHGGLTKIRPAEHHEFPGIEAQKQMTLEEFLHELLVTYGPMTGSRAAGLSGRDKPWQRSEVMRVLAGSQRFEQLQQALNGEPVFRAVVQRPLGGVR